MTSEFRSCRRPRTRCSSATSFPLPQRRARALPPQIRNSHDINRWITRRFSFLLLALAEIAHAQPAQTSASTEPLQPVPLEGPFLSLQAAQKSTRCEGRFTVTTVDGTNLLRQPSEPFQYAALDECKFGEDHSLDVSSSSYAVIVRTRSGFFILYDKG